MEHGHPATLAAPMPPLRRLRRRKGWSIRDLAREAGVSADTVLDLENGRREARPSTMRKLAAALGVAIAEVDEFDAPTS